MFGHIRHMPNLFVLGARRAGAASLAHYLSQHPAIRFTEPYDTDFFRRDELFRLGSDYYIQQFCRHANAHHWLGEATSSYFAYPHVVGPHLQSIYGDAPLKLVVLLREPVSRAWSHYLSRVNHGYEKRDFATALAQESTEPYTSEARYFGEGRYAHLLQEWQSYFPAESFLFLLSEDMAANPLAQVRRVINWLGEDATMPINVSDWLNAARYSHSPKIIDFLNQPPALLSTLARQIWPETWKRKRIVHKLHERFQSPYGSLPPIDPMLAGDLRRRYRNDILALSKRLGRYLSHWLTEEEVTEAPVTRLAVEYTVH